MNEFMILDLLKRYVPTLHYEFMQEV